MAEANDGVVTRCYTVRFERRSKHSAERFWRAITQAEEITRWMGYPAQIDLRPGGAFHVDFASTGGGELDGVIVRVEPKRRLTYAWNLTIVEWGLEDAPDGGCAYSFVQAGLPDRGEGEEDVPAGWHEFLDHLEAHLEGRAEEHAPRHASWKALKPRYREQLERTVRR